MKNRSIPICQTHLKVQTNNLDRQFVGQENIPEALQLHAYRTQQSPEQYPYISIPSPTTTSVPTPHPPGGSAQRGSPSSPHAAVTNPSHAAFSAARRHTLSPHLPHQSPLKLLPSWCRPRALRNLTEYH